VEGGQTLQVSASPQNLKVLACNLEYFTPGMPPGAHIHLDAIDGEPAIAADSIPVVVSLE
jgi:hypothetical protein